MSLAQYLIDSGFLADILSNAEPENGIWTLEGVKQLWDEEMEAMREAAEDDENTADFLQGWDALTEAGQELNWNEIAWKSLVAENSSYPHD